MAQGYSYSCNTIKLGSNFRKNFTSVEVNSGWCLDGCARWREVTITLTIKLNWVIMFKVIHRLGEENGVGAWMAARGGARLQLRLQ